MKTNSYYEDSFKKADEFGHDFSNTKHMSPLGKALFDMMVNNNRIYAANLELSKIRPNK